jgi:LEA14-like dessication related protein
MFAPMAMNKTGILLLFGVLGYALLQTVRKSQAIKALNWNVSGVDFNRKDKTFVVMLRLINPANASIRIRSIVGNVLWKGYAAAVIDYRNETVLKPNEEKTLLLAVKPNADLVAIISDLVLNKKQALNGTMEINGTINAEGLVVPWDYKQEFKLV